MTAIKIRIGGAWVDSDLTAKARIGGAWVDFGPAGGTDEVLQLPSPPTNLDLDDGGQAYNMGLQFSVTATCDCLGVEWYVPTNTPAPPLTDHAVSLWALAPTRLAFKVFTPANSTKQRVLFDTPVSLAPGEYTVGVYTNHYVFTTGPVAGIESPSGNLTVTSGRLVAYNGGAATAPIPGDPTTGIFHVSPITTVP